MISFILSQHFTFFNFNKEEFWAKWDKKYPSILRFWDANWAELTTFFKDPEEVRLLIYTTNVVEAYHRMVRKFMKAKSIFPTGDSIRKVVYLSVKEIIMKKWTMPARDWAMVYNQILIYFADRFAAWRPVMLSTRIPDIYT
jgi:putative transposase